MTYDPYAACYTPKPEPQAAYYTPKPEPKAAEPKTSSRASLTPARLTFFLLAGAAVAIAASYNLQPWLVIGFDIAQQIQWLPGLGLLSRIPWIGGWFLLAAGALGQITGVVLWAWVQVVQVAPMLQPLARKEWLSELRKYRAGAYVLEGFALLLRFPPYVGGYDAFWFDFARWDWALIDWANLGRCAAAVLAFEFIVAFLIKAYRGLNGLSR